MKILYELRSIQILCTWTSCKICDYHCHYFLIVVLTKKIVHTLPTITVLQYLFHGNFYQLKAQMMINIGQPHIAHMYRSFHTQPELHQANPSLVYFCSVKLNHKVMNLSNIEENVWAKNCLKEMLTPFWNCSTK